MKSGTKIIVILFFIGEGRQTILMGEGSGTDREGHDGRVVWGCGLGLDF